MNKKMNVAGYFRCDCTEEQFLWYLKTENLHYNMLLEKHPMLINKGIYADRTAGTKGWKRPELMRLFNDCSKGNVELIITRSISKIYRDVLQCLEFIRKLQNMNPPVGIYFINENINTFDMDAKKVSQELSL